jgi:Protein of unknown function (DUF2905)
MDGHNPRALKLGRLRFSFIASYTNSPDLVNKSGAERTCRGFVRFRGASRPPQLQVECRQNPITMDSPRELGKVLVACGLALAAAGAFLWASGKLPFRLGRLPGDVVYKGSNSSFYFPVVTCILLSVILSVAIWLVNYFRR